MTPAITPMRVPKLAGWIYYFIFGLSIVRSLTMDPDVLSNQNIQGMWTLVYPRETLSLRWKAALSTLIKTKYVSFLAFHVYIEDRAK